MKKSPHKTSDVRDKALDIIYNIFEKGAYTNLQLDKDLRNTQISMSDKRFITELVNGTVRMSKHLDWVLNLFLRKPLPVQNPWIRNILRLALYQIIFTDKIPSYAIVNTAVNQTKTMVGSGLTGMVNGVLRNLIRNPDKILYPSSEDQTAYLAVYYSHPEWLVEKWLDDFGYEQTVTMLNYDNLPAKPNLRWNRLRTTSDELIGKLAEEGILASLSPIQPWALEVTKMEQSINESKSFKQGLFYVQDSASMFAAPILQPNPQKLVYDLCCGVGGKATHIAELMNNEGRITAIDLYEHKIELLNYNSQRLGINIIEGLTQDILAMDTDRMEKAARVMLDAPCSGLGVLNRRADARWRKSYHEIKDLTAIQESLLKKASSLVERGGLLLYSTCTINPVENEDRINSFLQTHTVFALKGFEPALASLLLSADERKNAANGMFNLLPGRFGTNGMFYALMRRN
jgi:16S rRNA (cytosine967-C5)-methyltransferase